MHESLLLPGGGLPESLIADAVRNALAEDLGNRGDITSAATIPPAKKAKAKLVARKPGVISGLACAAETFHQLDRNISFRSKIRDGGKVVEKDVLAEIEGPAISILSGERVALNFVGHLSGIASLTAVYVAKIAHTKAKILDTRKTTPGLRVLEKYAVQCGGGVNHRMGLFDAVLIKDNHISVAGGISAALKAARAAVGRSIKVEIEVDSLDQLAEVLKTGGADIVMLDNMDIATMTRAVALVAGKLTIEASGGVNLETVTKIAETGVDVISIGALTHSAPSLDVALDIEL